MLDGKAKGAHRELNIKTNILTVKFEEANAEARKLREEMEATRHGQLMGEPQGVETMKLRNKFLQVCYQEIFSKYQSEKIFSEHILYTTFEHPPLILKERIEAQERKITNLELSRQLAAGGGGSKKSDADTIIKKLTDAEEKEKECQKVIDFSLFANVVVVHLKTIKIFLTVTFTTHHLHFRKSIRLKKRT